MARAGITLNDVSQAASQLQGRGHNPTVDGIRQLLGTGSKTTITQLLREWRSQQQEAAGALPRELLSLVTGLWERLNQQTERRMERYTVESRQEIQSFKEKMAQLQREIQSLQTQKHQHEETIAILQAEKIQQVTLLNHEQQEHTKVRQRQEQLLLQIEESKTENKRLHELAQHIQANLEHYQDAIQQQSTEQTLATEKLHLTFQQEREAMQQQLFAQQEQVHTLLMELQVKSHQEQEYTALKNDYAIILEKQELILQEYAVLKERYEQLEKVTQQQTQELKNEHLIKQEMEKQNLLLTERVSLMVKSLHQAEDKIEKLRQEKLFLVEEKSKLQGYIESC